MEPTACKMETEYSIIAAKSGSPPAPEESGVTLEHDELYTCVEKNYPPSKSEGWTLTAIEHTSRYWATAEVGRKTEDLFERGVQTSWQWAASAQFIRWFSDGERRYAQVLWNLASLRLSAAQVNRCYGHWKVWRAGLEVAIKIKGSQGRRRVEWLKVEHPFTAISAAHDVHANHNEAHNSCIRKRCSAYRRRQNHDAKTRAGLQRAITVQRLFITG